MLLKFKNPENADEAGERFTLIEDRGDRVLVADASDFWNGKIRPQSVYLATDLEPAND